MPRVRRATIVLLLLLLVAVAAVIFAGLRGRRALPPLTRANFDAAWRRWEQSGPADYELQVRVTGRQPATYRVVVRGGEVEAAFRNDDPLRQRRTMGTWSVPGMFQTIESDLLNMERVAGGQAERLTPRVSARAEFHSRFGYPVRYLRSERMRQGANPDVSWHVVRFEKSAE